MMDRYKDGSINVVGLSNKAYLAEVIIVKRAFT